MKRIVLDTNVLLSAGMSYQSVPSEAVVRVIRNGVFLKSLETESEFHESLAKPKLAKFFKRELVEQIHLGLSSAQLIPITRSLRVCRNPDDDKFLELAVNGHADVIVTGDNDLLVLNPFRNIPILTPAEFLAWIGK